MSKLADILGNSGSNAALTLWENISFTTGIEKIEKNKKPCDIHYYMPGNELWIIPNKIVSERQIVQIFDSQGRLIFSEVINCSGQHKIAIKLPFSLKYKGLIHIKVGNKKGILARKSMMII